MEIVLGFVLGISFFILTQVVVRSIEAKMLAKKEQQFAQAREGYKNFEKLIDSLPHYKFAVNKDDKGWKWEVLYLYVGRGLTYRYEPVSNAYGHELTKEAAIEAGRSRCEQLTNIKKWKEQREVYSL